MSDHIIKTKGMSKETLDELLSVLTKRTALERKEISRWLDSERCGGACLTKEALKDLKDKHKAVQREHVRLFAFLHP